MENKRKILAACSHTGGTNAIVPVIQKLKQDNLVDLTVIGHEFSKPVFEKAGIRYESITDFFVKDVSRKSAKSILRQIKPDLVFMGTCAPNRKEDYLEQQLTLSANEIKIPSLTVLDCWAEYLNRFRDFSTGEEFKYTPSQIAIPDVYAQKQMQELGFDSSNLKITGIPSFDTLEEKAKNFSKEDKENLRKQINSNTKDLFFYVASSWKSFKDEFGFWDLDVLKIINKNLYNPQDITLAVKLHPRTPENELAEISNYIKQNPNNKLVSNVEPRDLILASDLVLTTRSSLAFDTVYSGKPCISLQPGLIGENFLSILTDNNIIPGGFDYKDCKSLIQKSSSNNYRQELVQKSSNFKTDGKATERVTNLIYKTLKI